MRTKITLIVEIASSVLIAGSRLMKRMVLSEGYLQEEMRDQRRLHDITQKQGKRVQEGPQCDSGVPTYKPPVDFRSVPYGQVPQTFFLSVIPE